MAETWLIDPVPQQAEFSQRNQAGIYEIVHAGKTMYQRQQIRNFSLDVTWLWQQPLPQLSLVLRQLKLTKGDD